jgi:flagellar protein FlbD
MIKLHKLNGAEFALNVDLIQTIEANPDTIIKLIDGNHFPVKEPMDIVLKRIIEFKRSIYIAHERGEGYGKKE